ncbi:MAG: leucine-rich repeat domain-containing protein [Hyphomicrobiales bacterium]
MHNFTKIIGMILVIVTFFFSYDWYKRQPAIEAAYAIAQKRIKETIAWGDHTQLDLSDLLKLNTLPSQISTMDKLETLILSDTNVSDLGPIARLPALKNLHIKNTPVSDLSALSKSPRLEKLIATKSKVFDLEPLASILTLRHLVLNGTTIKSLEPTQNMTSLRHLNLYNSYANDGSQKYYRALLAKGVKVVSGSAYKQNYKPGMLYKTQVFLARLASDFSDRYDAARKMVVFLQPPKKYSRGENSICVNNHTGSALSFYLETTEGTSNFRLAHNSWHCQNNGEDAKLTISHSNSEPKICTREVEAGQTIVIKEFDASDVCKLA